MIHVMRTEMTLVICTVPLNDWIASVTVCVSVCKMLNTHNSTKFDRTLVVTASAQSVSCTSTSYRHHLDEFLTSWSFSALKIRSCNTIQTRVLFMFIQLRHGQSVLHYQEPRYLRGLWLCGNMQLFGILARYCCSFYHMQWSA